MPTKLYNPLDKENLARSIEFEILSRDVEVLANADRATGAGVYALYYRGSFEPYSKLSAANERGWSKPVYVGRAIPKGGRKGGMSFDVASGGSPIAARLRKHAASLASASNLEIDEFVYRSVALDDIWIPLGENILIERFQPLWNIAVDGFGINDPGKGRLAQKKSEWDVLHPGRTYAEKLTGVSSQSENVLKKVKSYMDIHL